MKRKRYIEPLWPISIMLGVSIAACLSGILFATYIYLKDDIHGESFGLIVSASLCLFFVIWFVFMLPRLIARLTIKNNYIIWKCPLHKTIKMSVEDCVYVGLEDSSQAVHFRYSMQEAVWEVSRRGDEMVYIYLSKTPFPKKYTHKAVAAPCKEGFIKFSYSDVLCQDLVKILPKGKTHGLIAFYNSMQASDRIRKLKKQEKSQKRKSKKK